MEYYEINDRESVDSAMSHTGGDYDYWREATEAEVAVIVEQEADAVALQQLERTRQERIRQAIQTIRDINDRPEHPEVVGEEVANTRTIYGGGHRNVVGADWIWYTRNIYGGGHRIVVGADWIWYIRGNGADGDDWSVNNLPGEIAWRAPYSDELAAAIVGGSIM